MAEDTLPEEWRAVVDFPDYEVSSLGRVRRSNPIARNGHRIGIKVLKGNPDTATGYPRVTLQREGGKNCYRHIHVLVCIAFHGPRPSPLHEVAHGDGDKLHNYKDNLRWTTNAGNHLDRQIHGNAAKKLTREQVRYIRSSLLNGPALADKLGVARSTINRIRSGNKWGWLS